MGLTGKKPIARIIFSSLSRVLPETGILFVVQGAGRLKSGACLLLRALFLVPCKLPAAEHLFSTGTISQPAIPRTMNSGGNRSDQWA
jgi:hypothetical protein